MPIRNKTNVEYATDFEKKSQKFLKQKEVKKAFNSAVMTLEKHGIGYPSLRIKKVEPKSENKYQFRISKKYRCCFIFSEKENTITILNVGDHL